MSAIAGMSRSMFVSEFKSSVGEPPMQHLRRWRLALVADSLIVDPWGRVLADGGDAVGVVQADLDLNAIATARAAIPALAHDRDFNL